MLYLKSYCYNKHELPFLITQLQEGYDYVDKFCIYEYNYTHTGILKDYEMEKVLHLIPNKLKNKLYYCKVDLAPYIIETFNEEICHNINERIQRNWFFNDPNINLKDDDIIIDVDCDEIIYKNSYKKLLQELNNDILGIRMNLFFYKNNYLWTNNVYKSSAICKYKTIKNKCKIVKNLKTFDLRYPKKISKGLYGCHMSWVMPVQHMVEKCYKTAHTSFRHLAKKEILEKAIIEKKYIFDLKRPFNILELSLTDYRIPKYLQKKNIFEFLLLNLT